MKEWEKLKTSDLATLNAQLRDAHLPELKVEVHSDAGGGEGDEE
jgi:hypothetical protein